MRRRRPPAPSPWRLVSSTPIPAPPRPDRARCSRPPSPSRSWWAAARKAQLAQLKHDIQAAAAQVETLKRETRSGFESTQRQLEAREQQLARDLKAVQKAVEGLTETVKAHRGKIAESATRSDVLAKETQELRHLVQSTTRTLVDFLRSEEGKSLTLHDSTAEPEGTPLGCPNRRRHAS